MILKYKVPSYEQKRYNNKKYLYCVILDKIEIAKSQKEFVYKVRVLNNNNRIDIFNSKDLIELNFIDRIKMLKGGKNGIV